MQTIQSRCADDGISVAGKLAVALVIREDDDDVRRCLGMKGEAQNREESQKAERHDSGKRKSDFGQRKG
jgi:hypothetical protein